MKMHISAVLMVCACYACITYLEAVEAEKRSEMAPELGNTDSVSVEHKVQASSDRFASLDAKAVQDILDWNLSKSSGSNTTWGVKIVRCAVTNIDCGYACELKDNDPYAITCAVTGSVSFLEFYRGTTKVLTCTGPEGCTKEQLGYSGNGSSDVYNLFIESFNKTKDTSWECRDGTSSTTCTINIIEPPTFASPTGLQGNCSISGDKFVIWCSGLITIGNPALELKIQVGSDMNSKNASSIMLTTEMKDSLNYKCYIDGPASKCVNTKATVFEGACPGVPGLSVQEIVGIAVGVTACCAVCVTVTIIVVKKHAKR